MVVVPVLCAYPVRMGVLFQVLLALHLQCLVFLHRLLLRLLLLDGVVVVVVMLPSLLVLFMVQNGHRIDLFPVVAIRIFLMEAITLRIFLVMMSLTMTSLLLKMLLELLCVTQGITRNFSVIKLRLG